MTFVRFHFQTCFQFRTSQNLFCSFLLHKLIFAMHLEMFMQALKNDPDWPIENGEIEVLRMQYNRNDNGYESS